MNTIQNKFYALSCTRLRILLNTICRKPGFNSLRTPLNHGAEQASNETLKQTQRNWSNASQGGQTALKEHFAVFHYETASTTQQPRGEHRGTIRMARLQAPLRGKDKVIIHSPHWTMLKVPTVRFVGKRFMTKLASCNLCKIFKRNILLFLKLLFGCGATTPFARLKMIYTSRIKIPWVYVTAKPFAIN